MVGWDIDMLLKYPLITTQKGKEFISYRGILYINERDYEVFIKTNSYNDFNSFHMELKSGNKQFHEEVEIIKTMNFKNIVNILDNIKFLIESKTLKHCIENHTHIYKWVLHEYSEFTKFFLNLIKCEISSNLKSISIATVDEEKRKHHLKIAINYNEFRDIFEVKAYDLPQIEEKDLFKKSNSLTVLYDQFLSYLEALQPFWNLMDIFDRCCSILDPENPKKCDNYRRIWLGNTVSVIVTVDPFSVNIRPDIKFLGPEKLIEKYRNHLNNNLENWDNCNDFFQETLNLLGLDGFPQRSDHLQKGLHILKDEGECSICFSLRLNDNLPEIICKNKSCQNFYHAECLYEWLISVNAKRVFSDICGQCPNCEKGISCPIPI